MITVYKQVREGTVWFKSGHFYTIAYTNFENDPMPTGVMLNYIKESGREYAVIATKADKINRSEYKKYMDRIRTVLALDKECEVIAFSSLKRMGIEEVWSKIETILE